MDKTKLKSIARQIYYFSYIFKLFAIRQNETIRTEKLLSKLNYINSRRTGVQAESDANDADIFSAELPLMQKSTKKGL